MSCLFGRFRHVLFPVVLLVLAASVATAQSITGTVEDSTGAVVPGATVEIHNVVSGFDRKTTTDNAGSFTISNLPLNPYHLTVTHSGFADYVQDVEVRSSVAVVVNPKLQVESAVQTVDVNGEAADLIENTSTFHTDVDRNLFDKVPLESPSSSVSSLVTLTTPGIAADSNGLFHGLGDHAENSFSVDGQPITDQQSKVFSNQIPLDSIQSLEVISGAPPAEFGEKTSVVINVTTRSGLGMTTPTGSVTASYGSFGTSNFGFNLAYGGKKWGNFISANGLNSGRFLDPPEFEVIHDKGNEENVFDRFDYQATQNDALHFNFNFTRSWFQNPDSFDDLHIGGTDPFGNPVPQADQRAQIKTFNFAPSWNHVLSPSAVFTLGAFLRHDQYNYYPSNNPFADLGPIQQETVSQDRGLTNAGFRSDLSYVKGIHNVKGGLSFQNTHLRESTNFGIVDPLLNAPCLDATGAPVPGFTNASQCAGSGLFPNDSTNPAATAPFLPFLGCNDLTRPTPDAADGCAGANSTTFPFRGSKDIKLFSAYIQDQITWHNLGINLGLRNDYYDGFVTHDEVQPRLGLSYNIKRTNTVLRASYARVLETPFNENLILSNSCNVPVIAALVPCVPANFSPGWRNEFHAGLEQAFGKYLVVSGEYIWKYTHNAYDFSILGATPITFPIEWHNSKIHGYAVRISVPNYKGFTALTVFSGVAARFFPPQVGGLGVTVGQSGLPFRIDHDEKFNQTTHLQYQLPWKHGPWVGFNWRYDSGLVAGAVPFATDTTTPVDLTGFTADQQLQIGLHCGNSFPTLTSPLTSCDPNLLKATRVVIPSPGTENDDKNPPRIAPRHLFDLAIGHDNVFGSESRYKVGVQFTAVNLTNEKALYNFLSTFSGTHFVTPRAFTGEVTFHF
jgi:hypothetical protein